MVIWRTDLASAWILISGTWLPFDTGGGGGPAEVATASFRSGLTNALSPALAVGAAWSITPAVAGTITECAGFTTANATTAILTPEAAGRWRYEWDMSIRVPRTQVAVMVEAELDLFNNQNRAEQRVTLNAAEGWKAVSGGFDFNVPGDFALSSLFRMGVIHRASDLAGYGGTIVFEIANYGATLTFLGDCP
jgi:hypothetical protein